MNHHIVQTRGFLHFFSYPKETGPLRELACSRSRTEIVQDKPGIPYTPKMAVTLSQALKLMIKRLGNQPAEDPSAQGTIWISVTI